MTRKLFPMAILGVLLFMFSHFVSPEIAFSASKADKKPDPTKKLVFAEKNRIKYEIYKVNLNLPDQLSELDFTYSIEFPSLTQEQFDLLMNRFKGQNLVTWKAGQRYSLIDFLHPKIQALVHRTLEQNYLEFEVPEDWRNPMRPEMEYETGMACWDTVYEVIREFNAPFRDGVTEGRLFHIGAPLVEAVMKNAAFFDKKALQSLSFSGILPGEKGFSERNSGRQFGDVLMIDTMANGGIGAAHVMLWLDDDLYFEKPDMGSQDPFRLVFYEDGVRFWLTDIVISEENREQLHGTFYRYNKPLPDPLSFTGRTYLFDWDKGTYPKGTKPKGTLPKPIADKFIWNLDIGLGGGLSKYRVNPVQRFKMGKDSSCRAIFIGADKDWFKKVF
ncbi:MAG: hypothetical protein HQM10_25580 [Candidatus Riflebacteria bacterium]|nr:hypothetical protein [Candidatus Riflebacteria bacterium]